MMMMMAITIIMRVMGGGRKENRSREQY